METIVLQPADRMTTAQCVMECCGYLRTIANQEYEGEDWQTVPKYRRRNLLTDFLACIELSGEEFAELCGLIGFQLSKTTTAKLAKFTVIAYDWQSEANGEATPDILAALDKCEGVTLIEQRGYRPQARTYDYLRFHIAAFWRCLVNELRSLCLGIGLVVYPKEIPATSTEAPRISKETAETVNVSAEGEKEAQRAKNKPTFADVAQMVKTELAKNKAMRTAWHLEFPDGTECDVRYKLTAVGCDFYEYTETRNGEEAFKDYKATECDITFYICQRLGIDAIEPPQSTETPQTTERTTDTPKPRETARKPQNRGIGSTRHSRLGANGYTMLDNASATLTAMHVPRECSTADAAYW